MMNSKNWKKPVFFIVAAGITGFSSFGAYNIVNACQDQASNQAVTLDISGTQNNLSPGGSGCNPLGCAACHGCVALQYRQNIESSAGVDIQTQLNQD